MMTDQEIAEKYATMIFNDYKCTLSECIGAQKVIRDFILSALSASREADRKEIRRLTAEQSEQNTAMCELEARIDLRNAHFAADWLADIQERCARAIDPDYEPHVDPPTWDEMSDLLAKVAQLEAALTTPKEA